MANYSKLQSSHIEADKAPSHYLNQWWNNFHWTLRYKFQRNFYLNSNIFIQQIAFVDVVFEMAAIFCRPKWVNVIIKRGGSNRGYFSILTTSIISPINLFVLAGIKYGCDPGVHWFRYLPLYYTSFGHCPGALLVSIFTSNAPGQWQMNQWRQPCIKINWYLFRIIVFSLWLNSFEVIIGDVSTFSCSVDIWAGWTLSRFHLFIFISDNQCACC